MNALSMSLTQLLSSFTEAPEHDHLLVTGMALDSRRVQPGDLFVALAGEHHHGLDFAAEAIQAGCAAIATDGLSASPSTLVFDRVPVITVPGLARNLGLIASRFYGHPADHMCVIGVTGTNGKTSCVNLLAQALSLDGIPVGTLGTLGYGVPGRQRPASHTTPDAISVQRTLADLRHEGVSHVAMEVSSHALDQGRVCGLRFSGAIFTNLSRDHLDYHPDMSTYFEAKARLFTRPGLGFAILNADDARTATLRHRVPCGAMIIDYGIGSGMVSASDVICKPDGLSFALHSPFGDGQVTARLLGRFNVYNLLAVAASLGALGWPATRIIEHLGELTPVAGRMNALTSVGQPLVVIDYAHSPDALEQTLLALRAHTQGQLYCVFGCGGDRDQGKRPLMGAVAEAHADRVVVTDDNPRCEDGDQIVRDIVAGARNPAAITIERDRGAAIALAIKSAGAGDVVLVAGKGHELYQDVAGERRRFDDRQVAAAAMEALA